MKDAFAVCGLFVLGWGCWQVCPAIAGIVIGSLLLVGGLAAHFYKGSRK